MILVLCCLFPGRVNGFVVLLVVSSESSTHSAVVLCFLAMCFALFVVVLLLFCDVFVVAFWEVSDHNAFVLLV